MFKDILVPTNFAAENKGSLDIAVGIAQLSGGNIYVLHVIKTIPNTAFEEFEDFYRKLEKQAQRNMTTLLNPYQDSPVIIESAIIYGGRVREILRFAEDHHIDLIVMTSHKIDPDKPAQGWGTISHKVGVLANCPIMLVK